MLAQSIQTALASIPFAALLSPYAFLGTSNKTEPSPKPEFVTVVYDDFAGIKRPIGLIHKISLRGQMREVFTFCCHGKRQPGMALFVRKRTGNMAEQVALSFEEQDIIPRNLKCLPDDYKNEHFRAFSMAC